MPISASYRIAIAVLCSCAIVGCQTAPATNGAGYQITRFSDPEAARLSSQDATTGPAIASNNAQCRLDPSCRK